ncbi:MAG: MFS transporter [Coxiellaceae bacterium]|nr:MFS transporter [Coxiellaceae bacterium]
MNHRHKRPIYPWLCWLIVAAFYLFQYGLLVVPSVFSDELRQSLGIDRTDVGVLFSAFLYTYVLMQIPVGVIFDRFRSRNVLFLASMVIILGCLIFTISHNLWFAILGRMVMGFGGAFAFIGALYIGRSWFPVVMFPLIVGLTEAMSGLSEIGLMPLLGILKNHLHWRTIILIFTLIIVIVAILIFFFVREHHPERKIKKPLGRSDFNLILKNPVMWLLSFYVGLAFAFDMVIANMWGVPLLIAHYHIPTWMAALESGMIMVGFTIGCYLVGWIARFVSDRLLMMYFAIGQFIVMLLLWYLSLDLIEVGILVFLIGFLSSSMVLSFDFAKKIIPETSYGLASGFINMFFGGTGILVSPLVGYIFETTKNENTALIPVIVCAGLAAVCGVLLKTRTVKFLPVKQQGG